MRIAPARRPYVFENKAGQPIGSVDCGCESVAGVSAMGEENERWQVMGALEFVSRYVELLEEIDALCGARHYPTLRRLYCIDPHDLVTPETQFKSLMAARVFIANLVENKTKELQNGV